MRLSNGKHNMLETLNTEIIGILRAHASPEPTDAAFITPMGELVYLNSEHDWTFAEIMTTLEDRVEVGDLPGVTLAQLRDYGSGAALMLDFMRQTGWGRLAVRGEAGAKRSAGCDVATAMTPAQGAAIVGLAVNELIVSRLDTGAYVSLWTVEEIQAWVAAGCVVSMVAQFHKGATLSWDDVRVGDVVTISRAGIKEWTVRILEFGEHDYGRTMRCELQGPLLVCRTAQGTWAILPSGQYCVGELGNGGGTSHWVAGFRQALNLSRMMSRGVGDSAYFTLSEAFQHPGAIAGYGLCVANDTPGSESLRRVLDVSVVDRWEQSAMSPVDPWRIVAKRGPAQIKEAFTVDSGRLLVNPDQPFPGFQRHREYGDQSPFQVMGAELVIATNIGPRSSHLVEHQLSEVLGWGGPCYLFGLYEWRARPSVVWLYPGRGAWTKDTLRALFAEQPHIAEAFKHFTYLDPGVVVRDNVARGELGRVADYFGGSSAQPQIKDAAIELPEPWKSDVQFYYEHGVNVVCSDWMKRQYARRMAMAVDLAHAKGWIWQWGHDADPDVSWMDEEQQAEWQAGSTEILSCALIDDEGTWRESTGGIHVSVNDRAYCRVVEAELAEEALAGELPPIPEEPRQVKEAALGVGAVVKVMRGGYSGRIGKVAAASGNRFDVVFDDVPGGEQRRYKAAALDVLVAVPPTTAASAITAIAETRDVAASATLVPVEVTMLDRQDFVPGEIVIVAREPLADLNVQTPAMAVALQHPITHTESGWALQGAQGKGTTPQYALRDLDDATERGGDVALYVQDIGVYVYRLEPVA